VKIHPDFDQFVSALNKNRVQYFSEEVWKDRKKGRFGDHDVFYIDRKSYLKNKRAIGRHKDLADVESLGEIP